MKYSSLPMVGALGLVFILAVMAAAPQVVMADVERQVSQQGSLVVDAKPGEPVQPPPSSGDVQERALPQGVVPNLGRRLPPTTTSFGCNVVTRKCKCYDSADCAWMKSLISHCTVPAGCTQNCECTLP
jgi:hypothetical protein